MTKKIIYVRVGDPIIDHYRIGKSDEFINITNQEQVCVTGNIDSLIKALNEIKNEYSEYTDLKLEDARDCGCWGPCSCTPSYYVIGKRLETDLEYEFRQRQEAKIVAYREERERSEYEKLKQKFETKT